MPPVSCRFDLFRHLFIALLALVLVPMTRTIMVLACLVLAGSNFRASARFLLTSHLRLPSRMHSKENSPVSLLLLGLELALCCLAMNLVVAHDNPSDLLLPPSDVTALPSCFAQSEPGEGTSTSNESIARRIDSDLVDCCKVGSSLVSEYVARVT